VPQVQEDYKWSRPVFGAGKDFAYLKAAKSHVTFGLVNAEKLHDPHNRLEGTGKDMRHVKLRSMADIDPALFKEWIIMLIG